MGIIDLSKRTINKIIIHCSDSDVLEHDNLETIRKWHVDERGRDDVGYHYVITKNGNVHGARPLKKAGAHCKGHNQDSIGVCLTGKDVFSPDQYFTLAWLLNDLLKDNPTVKEVKPHWYYNAEKTCPNFNLQIFNFKTE